MNKDKIMEETKKKTEAMIKDILERRYEILDKFAEAYMAETGLKPSECELVEITPTIIGGESKLFFRKRGEYHDIAIKSYKDCYNMFLTMKKEFDEGKRKNVWADIIDEFEMRIKTMIQIKSQDVDQPS